MKRFYATFLVICLMLMSVFGFAASAQSAESWPTQPIRFLIPFAAGGGTDLAARALQPYLESELGVPVIVENITGGSGWICWGELAKAKPDGYTLAYVVYPNLFTGYMNPSANRTETLESFTPIISHHSDTGLLCIRANEDRYHDVESFVKYAQEHDLASNSGGVGSSPHFAGVQFNKQLGTKLRFVQSDGGSEQLTQLLGEHIDVAVLDYAVTRSFIEAGDITVIGVLGDVRNVMLPDVPTVNEVMGSNIQQLLSRGISGPAGMDTQMVDKLVQSILTALADPDHQEKIQGLGMMLDGVSGEDYYGMLKNQEEAMKDVLHMFGW